MTIIVLKPSPLRTRSQSEANQRPTRPSRIKHSALADRDTLTRYKKDRPCISSTSSSVITRVTRHINELGFRFRKHETNKLAEPENDMRSVITGAVRDIRSPIARRIDVKIHVLHYLLEQNGIFSHDAELFFPWKELRMTLHSHRVYGAKRTAILLNLTRIQNYSDIESYVVAYSISCAENIRCRLPFDQQQDLHNRVGMIPVYVLAYDRDRVHLYSVHISTMLLSGLKSPTIALREHSGDVHSWSAEFQSGKEIRFLLCALIKTLQTEWHLPTTLEQSYQNAI